MFKSFFLSILFIILLANNLFAKNLPKDRNLSKKTESVEIRSDKLEVFKKKGIAIFQGAVVLKKGDIILNSDILYFKNKGIKEKQKGLAGKDFFLSSSEQISNLEAEGNLSIKVKESVLKAKKANLNLKTGILEMNKDVSVISGKNIINGDFLTYNTDSREIRVLSSKNKYVTGIIVPNKKKKVIKNKKK